MLENKFAFTEEGRNLLVSQTGGIKFAILGYMFVQGPAQLMNMDAVEFVKEIEEEAKLNNISFIQAIYNRNCIFIMNNVRYQIVGENGDTTGGLNTLDVISTNEYKTALDNYTNNLFGTFYLPAVEWSTHPNGEHFGTYAFNFDRTYLNCEITNDISFTHVLLVGKQYAETSDATFNINQLQEGSIVGVASFRQPGIQILKEQNPYVTYQAQLKFTVTPDEDISEPILQLDEDSPSNQEDWLSYWNKRFSLVNDGVKNTPDNSGITIGQNQQILDELELGTNGCVAMTKTLTVAEQCLDADDAENQFNAAGLIHPINKYPDKDEEYTPQIIMTSVHPTSALQEDITAYSVGMTVKCEGNEAFGIDTKDPDVAAPEFKLGHLPENDYIAVDIFGLENKKNMYSKDRFLFSNSNSATQPAWNDPNVIIDSDHNLFIEGGSCNNNTLLKSNYNTLSAYNKDTLLVGSDWNRIDGGNNNQFYASTYNTLLDKSHDNTFYSSTKNEINSGDFTLIKSTLTSAAGNATDFFIVNSTSTSATENSYKNTLYNSTSNIFSGSSTLNMLVDAKHNRFYDTTKHVVLYGSSNVTVSGSYDEYLQDCNKMYLRNSSDNYLLSDYNCTVVSATQNFVNRSRYAGIKGLALGTIRSEENPIHSDVQSNNNIINRGEYFDLFGSSDNIITRTYFLQSSDDNASLGPVRIKGTSIVNSSKSKLYNAREMYLVNSEYSRVYVMSDYTNQQIGLNGCSYEMAQGNKSELDSIYYALINDAEDESDLENPYAIKGVSYKFGAESVKDHCRPADMLKLKAQFTNTYGSELNLSEFSPFQKPKYKTPNILGATFEKANYTLMTPSVRPTNSNIIGGHHNKIIGGTNVTILGGEYCKASTYSHQVIMGKYNRDVPADLIYGCGHFNGATYTQGNQEYAESELGIIETMGGTIDGVRGDINGINGETCYNALEFYAHQGKLILRNCDDGHDRGTNEVDENFGKTIELSPAGITWRDNAGDITSELDLEGIQRTITWTFILSCPNPKAEEPYFVVDATIGVPPSVANIDKKTLASYLVKPVNLLLADEEDEPENIQIFTEGELTKANGTLFARQIPNKINVILMSVPVNNAVDIPTRKAKSWCLYNKIYPWYTQAGKTPRYNKNSMVTVEYFTTGRGGSIGDSWLTYISNFKSLLTSNNACISDDIKLGRNILQSRWDEFKLGNNVQGSQAFVSFNTNNIWTEWLATGIRMNTSEFYTRAEIDEKIGDSKTGITEAQVYNILQNAEWTATKATVATAENAKKINGWSIDPQGKGNATLHIENII